MKTVTLPKANGMPASTGTIQWTEVLAVSANHISLQSRQYLTTITESRLDLPNGKTQVADHADI